MPALKKLRIHEPMLIGDAAAWTVIVDSIDGTRGLMYDKRSAWCLAAVAPPGGGLEAAEQLAGLGGVGGTEDELERHHPMVARGEDGTGRWGRLAVRP